MSPADCPSVEVLPWWQRGTAGERHQALVEKLDREVPRPKPLGPTQPMPSQYCHPRKALFTRPLLLKRVR